MDEKLSRKYLAKLKKMCKDTEMGPEQEHEESDFLLVKLLRELGYDEIADQYLTMRRDHGWWYS